MSSQNDAGEQAKGAYPSPASASRERFAGWARRARELAVDLGRRERLLGIVTVIALLAGLLLIVADFVTLFQIKLRSTVIDETAGGDQHAYAVALIGAAVIGAALVARATGAWPPAVAVAGLGAAALAITLLADLPDATRSDLVRGGRVADASPALGLWLELGGGLIALLSGLALVYLLRSASAQQPAPRGNL